ncbi:MAG TPA: peptidoglycan-binding protein, partial [Xenococcaceae cyanobacterium]
FQEQNGELEVDGYVGPQTWAASFSLGTPTAQSETSFSPAMSAQDQVFNQIQEIEETVPGDYDPYIVAQTLRRKTNDKYRGTSFEIFTEWKDIPLVPDKYPDGDPNSTYAKAEDLGEFQGILPLNNGMDLPTAHFLAALSSQFGSRGESWNLTYVGDLGSVVGAMQYPDDWITSSGSEAEKTKEQLKSLSSPQSKLPIAIDAKAPSEQLDADIVAHVVGNLVTSESITISEAISDVSQMSKGEVYDRFLQSEFGYHLSELNNVITGPSKRWIIQAQLKDRISNFIDSYIALQNGLTFVGVGENLYDPLASVNLDSENLAMVADYFIEHIESNA